MSLERFCRKPIVTTTPDSTITEAAHTMRSAHVGAVIVSDGGRPLGILTDRDIVCRVLAEERDPTVTPVESVMTTGVAVAHENDLIDQVLFSMNERGVRRMPIVDERGLLVGMVSLDDLMVMLSAELGQAAEAVRSNRGP